MRKIRISPPAFLMKKGLTIENSTSTLQDFGLIDDAKGLNVKLRSKLPGLDMRSVVVGKWYVPFIFVKGDIIDQVKISMYYNMTLHQRWEEVFFYENVHNEDCVEVVVDVDLEVEVINVEGQKVTTETTSVDDAKGIVWFQVKDLQGQDKKIGLRSVIVERMESEEESFEWKKRDGDRVKIERLDRFEGGSSHWKSYKCYVLVERFELKRMDESLVLTYEFRHADKLRTIQY